MPLNYNFSVLPEKVVSRMAVVTSGDMDGCWLWLGAIISSGYGSVYLDGRKQLAHRVVYELLVGPIPEGLQIDHLCRVRRCVNPAHMEPVTNKENGRRGTAGQWQTAKNECPSGHPYDEANTLRIPSRPNARYCRACARARARTN